MRAGFHGCGLLSLFLLLSLAGCDQHSGNNSLAEGRPFPSLELSGAGNEPNVLIDSLRGKLVVLNVWATWCAPCRRELPSLQRLSEKLDPERFSVIGLSVDDDEHVMKEYLIDKGVTYANYIDKTMVLTRMHLKVKVFPSTLLISPEGILLRDITGEREWDDPGVIRALEDGYQGKSGLLFDI